MSYIRISLNDSQHNVMLNAVMLNLVKLSVVILFGHNSEYHYYVCYYTERIPLLIYTSQIYSGLKLKCKTML
jgi:hypothetical protein